MRSAEWHRGDGGTRLFRGARDCVLALKPRGSPRFQLEGLKQFDDPGYRRRIVDRRNQATFILLLTKFNSLIMMLVTEGISNARKVYRQHVRRATTVGPSFDRMGWVFKQHHGARDSENGLP